MRVRLAAGCWLSACGAWDVAGGEVTARPRSRREVMAVVGERPARGPGAARRAPGAGSAARRPRAGSGRAAGDFRCPVAAGSGSAGARGQLREAEPSARGAQASRAGGVSRGWQPLGTAGFFGDPAFVTVLSPLPPPLQARQRSPDSSSARSLRMYDTSLLLQVSPHTHTQNM